jgi:hypothetical protein
MKFSAFEEPDRVYWTLFWVRWSQLIHSHLRKLCSLALEKCVISWKAPNYMWKYKIEVSATVKTYTVAFCVTILCSLVGGNQCFRETYCIHLLLWRLEQYDPLKLWKPPTRLWRPVFLQMWVSTYQTIEGVCSLRTVVPTYQTTVLWPRRPQYYVQSFFAALTLQETKHLAYMKYIQEETRLYQPGT